MHLLLLLCLGLLMLLLGLVGTDAGSGLVRFAFEIPELGDGLGIAVLGLVFTLLLNELERMIVPWKSSR